VGLVRQSATTLASRLLVTIVNIPISMIVARTLGVEGQGVYAAAIAFPALWATVWILGLDASHTWALAGSRTSLGRVLGNTIVSILILSALSVPSYMLAVGLLNPEKMEALKPILWITALMVPLLLARTLLLSCFLGLHQVDQYNLLNVVSQLLLLALLVMVLVVGKGDTRAAVIAYGASVALLLGLAVLWVSRRRQREDPVRADATLMKSSLSYGMRGYGATLFGQMNYRFDQVLVTNYNGVAEQGYYSIAVLLAEKLTHISNSIQLVLFPRVSAATPEEANRITATACRHAVILVGAGALALYLLARPFIMILYGSEFLPALKALFCLIPGIFLLSFWKVLAVDLSGRNRRFPTTVAGGVAFVVNTVLNFLWIPKHGMVGAAWSSSISYGVQSLTLAFIFVRITGVPWRKLVVPERKDVDIYRRILARIPLRGRRT
jgi:O-antigen/teichoic acid export membrane protein